MCRQYIVDISPIYSMYNNVQYFFVQNIDSKCCSKYCSKYLPGSSSSSKEYLYSASIETTSEALMWATE